MCVFLAIIRFKIIYKASKFSLQLQHSFIFLVWKMPVTTCFRVFYIFELLIFCTSFHVYMLKNWIFWQKVLILAYFFHYEGEKDCENPLEEKKSILHLYIDFRILYLRSMIIIGAIEISFFLDMILSKPLAVNWTLHRLKCIRCSEWLLECVILCP